VAGAAGGASPAGASAPRSSADDVSAWFSEAVGTRCSLVQQQAGARSASHARRRHSQDSAPDEARVSIGAPCTCCRTPWLLSCLLRRWRKSKEQSMSASAGISINFKCTRQLDVHRGVLAAVLWVTPEA
jgi:hypothetical protein